MQILLQHKTGRANTPIVAVFEGANIGFGLHTSKLGDAEKDGRAAWHGNIRPPRSGRRLDRRLAPTAAYRNVGLISLEARR